MRQVTIETLVEVLEKPASSQYFLCVRCNDGRVYNLDMAGLAPRRRLTAEIRDELIQNVEEYCVGMPMQLSDNGEIDYKELLNTLRARRAVSTTE